VTADNLQNQLDQLTAAGEAMGRADAHMPGTSGDAHVRVMNEKKLKLKITVSLHLLSAGFFRACFN